MKKTPFFLKKEMKVEYKNLFPHKSLSPITVKGTISKVRSSLISCENHISEIKKEIEEIYDRIKVGTASEKRAMKSIEPLKEALKKEQQRKKKIDLYFKRL